MSCGQLRDAFRDADDRGRLLGTAGQWPCSQYAASLLSANLSELQLAECLAASGLRMGFYLESCFRLEGNCVLPALSSSWEINSLVCALVLTLELIHDTKALFFRDQ